MRQAIARFLNDENGATAIEYGLIAAGISMVIIVVVNGLGSKIAGTFSSIQSQMK
jgi:pilus assembly protein Flp/PilA